MQNVNLDLIVLGVYNMELLLLSLLSKIFTSCHFVVGICRMRQSFFFSVCVVPSCTYDTCFAIKYASYILTEVCITILKSSRCKCVLTSCFLAICLKVVFKIFFDSQNVYINLFFCKNFDLSSKSVNFTSPRFEIRIL